jgi:hypothetical protein
MPYVRKDEAGDVVALSAEALEGFEEVAAESIDVAAFQRRLGDTRAWFEESDLDVIRVLDDLVSVLVDKNVIRFTDLPSVAQQKLLARRTFREDGAELRLLID